MSFAKVEQLNFGLSAGAVAATYWFVTPHFAWSLAAGAFLEALNFGAIHRGARKLFSIEDRLPDGESIDAGVVSSEMRGWVGVFSIRFLVLAAAIFVTMQAGADPAAMLIGLSLAMPASIIDAWMHRPPVVDPATLPNLFENEEDESDQEYWENYSIWRPGRLLASVTLTPPAPEDASEGHGPAAANGVTGIADARWQNESSRHETSKKDNE